MLHESRLAKLQLITRLIPASFSKGVVKGLMDEMEGAGFECYETDIGGDGALFMEDIDEGEDATRDVVGPNFRRCWRKRKLQEEA